MEPVTVLVIEDRAAEAALVCAALALLDQIGEEAMRRANQAIDELKKRPRGK